MCSWPQATAWPTLVLRGIWCHVGAQTLGNVEIIILLMQPEQLKERSVFDAKADGVMCPALLELACEALASSGTAH